LSEALHELVLASEEFDTLLQERDGCRTTVARRSLYLAKLRVSRVGKTLVEIRRMESNQDLHGLST